MSGLDTYTTQQTIFDYLSANLGFDVVDSEVPDAGSVILTNGVLVPYVVVRFGDALANGQQMSFGGPVYDGYYSPMMVLCVAPSGLEALELSSAVNKLLIGWTPDANSGPLTKDFGGGSMAIKAPNSKPSFFVAITAFRFLTNMQTP